MINPVADQKKLESEGLSDNFNRLIAEALRGTLSSQTERLEFSAKKTQEIISNASAKSSANSDIPS